MATVEHVLCNLVPWVDTLLGKVLFSSLFLLSQWCVFENVLRGGAYLLTGIEKMIT